MQLIDEKIEQYIVDLVYATRTPADYGLSEIEPMIGFGCSPRASVNLALAGKAYACLLYTSPSPRDRQKSRMPSSA